MTRKPLQSALLAALGASALAAALSGCVPLVIGGAAAGGALMYSDRRTSGAQVDDEGIELKGRNRLKDAVGDRGHVSVTSYNRTVLITGQVPTDADKAAIGAAIGRIENVRAVLNEVTVGPNASLGDISNDALITSKVKASYVDARDLFANAYKVVTEAGTVFLMGRVTEREADRAAQVARGVNGVRKVVKAFEIVTEAELANRSAPQPAAPSASPRQQ